MILSFNCQFVSFFCDKCLNKSQHCENLIISINRITINCFCWPHNPKIRPIKQLWPYITTQSMINWILHLDFDSAKTYTQPISLLNTVCNLPLLPNRVLLSAKTTLQAKYRPRWHGLGTVTSQVEKVWFASDMCAHAINTCNYSVRLRIPSSAPLVFLPENRRTCSWRCSQAGSQVCATGPINHELTDDRWRLIERHFPWIESSYG